MAIDNRIEETLSALMDGETSELEVRRLLKEGSLNPGLRDTWHRYQLASAAMKRDLPPRPVDLSSSISAALDEEKPLSTPFAAFMQPLGKVAIAASVALVAVFGVQQFDLSTSSVPAREIADTDTSASTGNAQFQLPAGYDLPPVTARTVSAGAQPQSRPTVLVSAQPIAELADELAVRDYFNTMMRKHTETAARSSSSQGVLPFARLPQDEDAGR